MIFLVLARKIGFEILVNNVFKKGQYAEFFKMVKHIKRRVFCLINAGLLIIVFTYINIASTAN